MALSDRDGAIPHDERVRVRDAAELVAIDVFNAAEAANEPDSMALVKRHVAELLDTRRNARADTARPRR